MQDFDFFASSLPDSGQYCIATRVTKGGKSYWEHDFFTDKREAYDFALQLDNRGRTVFYAQGSFLTNTNRRGENALSYRSFFMDIDCGEDKPYPDQRAGVKALGEFCTTTGLPVPSVVFSGNGLYAYWITDADIPKPVWRSHAEQLKSLCIAYDFKADPSRTADYASVLRPVGSHNRKSDTPKPVELKIRRPVITLSDFTTPLHKAAKARGIKDTKAPKVKFDANAEFEIDFVGDVKPSAYPIANKCAQMGYFRDVKGNVDEPFWYAALGLLKTTVEAPEICHLWSTGHKDYDADVTDTKLAQLENIEGATTCFKFNSIRPNICDNCRFASKLKSPWRLGLPEPEVVELPVGIMAPESVVEDEEASPVDKEMILFLPKGFSRTKEGIIFDDGGLISRVYPYAMVAMGLVQDQLDQETMVIKAHRPMDGWTEILLPCAYLQDQKAAAVFLAHKGVHIPKAKRERELFYMLLEGWRDNLVAKRRKHVVSKQMGWVEESDGSMAFILGDRFITRKGIDTTAISHAANPILKALTPSGDLTAWTEATRMLNKPGLEPWAFGVAALGFGAPLISTTGYRGSLLVLTGPSGSGKSASAMMGLSVWGRPDVMSLIRQDTANASAAMIAFYNNLPVCMDEVTADDKTKLSDLVFQITQGRDKRSLQQNRKQREEMHWATIGALTSNNSIVEVLSGNKADASAEINRIFEYEVPRHASFVGETIYRACLQNHGLVGETYAKYLVDHYAELKPALEKLQATITTEAGCGPDERFWTITAACAIYGAYIANKLGLFHVDVVNLKKWVVSTIRGMRETRSIEASTGADWLVQFLNKNLHRTVDVSATNNVITDTNRVPYLGYAIRKEQLSGQIFVSQDAIKLGLLESGLRRKCVVKELEESGVLLKTNYKKTLAKDTHVSTAQEYCWVLDMNHELLSAIKLDVEKPKLATVSPIRNAA
jgi:hypothetical protein